MKMYITICITCVGGRLIYDVIRALRDADAVMTLRLQKERMRKNLITNLDQYHLEYGLTHENLRACKNNIPVLHPGPVNRGVEMSSAILEDNKICLVREQVSNGIPVRMALLYLMAAVESFNGDSLKG